LLNSRLGLFTAAPSCFTCESLHTNGAHLLPKLRCHFAEFLNEGSLKRLRILSPPTCVGLRYDHQINSLEAFLGGIGSASLRDKSLLITSQGFNRIPDLPRIPPYGLKPGCPAPGWPTFPRPPIAQTLTWWYRNINLFPITYAFRPQLRDRLTLSRLALLRKPWVFGEQVSHLLYRYLCQHNLFHIVHQSLRSGFNLPWNAPLPIRKSESRSFGYMLEPRYIFGADPFDQ
jgi:hypothetical protein